MQQRRRVCRYRAGWRDSCRKTGTIEIKHYGLVCPKHAPVVKPAPWFEYRPEEAQGITFRTGPFAYLPPAITIYEVANPEGSLQERVTACRAMWLAIYPDARRDPVPWQE